MRTYYFYAYKDPTHTGWFSLTPLKEYSHFCTEIDADIEFKNFNGTLYQIYYDNVNMFISDEKFVRTIWDSLIKFSYVVLNCYDSIFFYRRKLKQELKKYRGEYCINFSKIKKKYKAYKNKLISNYFEEFFWGEKCEMLREFICSNYGGFSPIDLEKYFKYSLLNKLKNTISSSKNINNLYVFPFKYFEYKIYDEFY